MAVSQPLLFLRRPRLRRGFLPSFWEGLGVGSYPPPFPSSIIPSQVSFLSRSRFWRGSSSFVWLYHSHRFFSAGLASVAALLPLHGDSITASFPTTHKKNGQHRHPFFIRYLSLCYYVCCVCGCFTATHICSYVIISFYYYVLMLLCLFIIMSFCSSVYKDKSSYPTPPSQTCQLISSHNPYRRSARS